MLRFYCNPFWEALMINRLKIADALNKEDLKFLRVLWCDNANVIRTKAIHLPSLKKQLSNDGTVAKRSEELLTRLERSLTNSAALQALPVMYDEPVPEAGLDPVKEIRLVPDWSTLVMLPYARGHAQVMGNLMLDKFPWELCPRELSRRAVSMLGDLGYQIKVGVEIEFFLFKQNQHCEGNGTFAEPVDKALYAQNSAFETSRAVIDDIAEMLWNNGIELAHYNPESGPGQHEISLHYCDPLVLADRLVSARETIRSVALKHGLIASFVPKLFDDATGSGCHLHLSLWSDDKNITPDGKGNWYLSQSCESFIAGILDHLPSLMAFTTPTPNSFRRIQPRTWSGAFRAWGIDNKEAAIRVLANPFGEGPNHFELKTADSSANPYIALFGVIAAGWDGIQRNLKLSDPVQADPANLTEAERKRLGVGLLPTNLEEALGKLDQDNVIKEAMGKEYYRVYTAVRRFEQKELKDLDLEKERKLLLNRY
jgi:glutamine synthetase